MNVYPIKSERITDYICRVLRFTGMIRGTECFLMFDLIGEIPPEIRPFTRTIRRDGRDVTTIDVWKVIEDMFSDPATNLLPKGAHLSLRKVETPIIMASPDSKSEFSRRRCKNITKEMVVEAVRNQIPDTILVAMNRDEPDDVLELCDIAEDRLKKGEICLFARASTYVVEMTYENGGRG